MELIQDCHRKSNIPEEVEDDTIRQQIGHNFKEETSQAAFRAQLCMVLTLGRIGKYIINNLKVFKCDYGEGYRKSVGRIV